MSAVGVRGQSGESILSFHYEVYGTRVAKLLWQVLSPAGPSCSPSLCFINDLSPPTACLTSLATSSNLVTTKDRDIHMQPTYLLCSRQGPLTGDTVSQLNRIPSATGATDHLLLDNRELETE